MVGPVFCTAIRRDRVGPVALSRVLLAEARASSVESSLALEAVSSGATEVWVAPFGAYQARPASTHMPSQCTVSGLPSHLAYW
jgi:hypothetical protein